MATRDLMKPLTNMPAMIEDLFKPWNEWFDEDAFFRRMRKVPPMNITENKDSFIATLAAPGLKKEDFNIDVDGNMLTISAEKEESKEKEGERFRRREYSYNSFSRSFTLPEDVERDKIDALYQDGVLTLRLPKRESARKEAAKHIAIK